LLVALLRLLLSLLRLLVVLPRLLSILREAFTLPIFRELVRGYLLPRDVVAFVPRLAAVSEARLALACLESFGQGPTTFGIALGGDRYVLTLQALFHVRLYLLGTTLISRTALVPRTASVLRTALFPASLLSASLPVSVVSHR
jgi:hypothetical protein